MKRNGNRRRGQMDWEAIFHGSRRRVRLMRRLKEYVNLSYDSEATIAKQMGANEEALTGWLAGKVKPTFQSLLKVRDFLERHVETRGGIAPTGYVPMKGNNPNGRRGKGREK